MGESTSQLDEIMQKFKNMMDSSLSEHHQRTKGEIISEVKDEMTKLTQEIIQNIETKVNETTRGIRCEIKGVNEKVENNAEKIAKCEKTEKFLLDSRRHKNIIVYGLDNKTGREERKNQLVWLFRDKMGTSFSKGDLDYYKELSKSKDKNPVLVRVTTMEMKYEIFSKRRNLKQTKIYIDDDIDKDTVEKRKQMRNIMKKMREEGKQAEMRRNKLYVNGEEYLTDLQCNETSDEQLMMEIDSETTNRAVPRGAEKEAAAGKKIRNTLKNLNNKRSRSPKEGGVEKTLKKQQTIAQYLMKQENFQRSRSNSEGSIVYKMVNEMEAKTPRKEKNKNKEGKELDMENTEKGGNAKEPDIQDKKDTTKENHDQGRQSGTNESENVEHKNPTSGSEKHITEQE